MPEERPGVLPLNDIIGVRKRLGRYLLGNDGQDLNLTSRAFVDSRVQGWRGNFSALPFKLQPEESGRQESNLHHSIRIRSNRADRTGDRRFLRV